MYKYYYYLFVLKGGFKMDILDKVKIIGIGFEKEGKEKFKKNLKNTKQEIRIIDEVLWNSSNFHYLYIPKKIVIALKELEED
tara:strand:- start:314 stop:559 length:246 start_codon:yes stop_codon:yes gene_type:complete